MIFAFATARPFAMGGVVSALAILIAFSCPFVARGDKASPSKVREVRIESGAEIALHLGRSPLTVRLPDAFRGAFYDTDAGFELNGTGETVTISPVAVEQEEKAHELPRTGSACVIVTNLGRLYALRVLPANGAPSEKEVVLRDLSPTPLYSRELVADGREAFLYADQGAPTVIAFRSDIARVYRGIRSTLWVETADNFLVVVPELHPPAVGAPLLVELEDGRLYPLRILPADETRVRDPTAVMRDRSPLPVYDKELRYTRGIGIYLDVGEPTAILFPEAVRSKFENAAVLGIEAYTRGRRLVVALDPDAIVHVGKLSVELESGKKYDIRLLRADREHPRMFNVRLH